MKDAMWEVDGNDGMGFADPRTRGAPLPGQQMLLWGGPKNPELLELVQQRLETGPVSLDRARALAPSGDRSVAGQGRQACSARPARHGSACGNPAGRLTKESVIRLR